ncbi:MAG: FtsX-like permease family protein [Pseudomonadota bacterium]
MRLRHFRIAWRALAQEPAYSLVVVLGLGIGVAACLLLLAFVRYSWEYNAQVPHAEQVYVVKMRTNTAPGAPWFDQAPVLLRAAAAQAPGVLAVTGYVPSRPQVNEVDGTLTVRIGAGLHRLHSLTVLPGFVDTLGLQAQYGSMQALEQPDSIAVTGQAATRLFGAANALGRTMQVEGKLLRVAAIVRTPPTNTTIPFEALISVNSVLVDSQFRQQMLTGEQGWWGKLLIRVRPGASVPAISALLQQAVDSAPAVQAIPPEIRLKLGKQKVADIALAPLRYAYFDQAVTGNHITGPGDRANPALLAGLGAIAVLILALAAINYVNLATVRVLRRQREVATRKVLGAGVRQLVVQYLAESVVVSMVATALGLLLAWLVLPVFCSLVKRQLEGVFSAANVGAALALGVMLGAATAAYPAWIATRVRPSEALAESPNAESLAGMRLRRVLTVLQVSTAMCLASVTLAIAWQTEFAMHAPPGFDPAPLLIVDLPESARESPQARGFVAALSAQPAVAGVAISVDAVGRKNMTWSQELKRPGGTGAPMDMKLVSANFFEQYRIKPLLGRLFDAGIDQKADPVPLVLNTIATRELGFATPQEALGQEVLFTGYDGKLVHKRVVGIAPELRFHSLREAPGATAYELWNNPSTLSVRAAASTIQAERAIESLWRRYFPDEILNLHRAGDIFAANYAEEARLARLLALATGIALAIAAFGTYVLAAHTVQRRSREIALRKLYGARRPDIGFMVVREIGILVGVSALIGLPIAAFAIERYLAIYVERAPIGYWTMLLALASTLAIAMAAVARQAWIAMRMMPSEALRA